MKEQMRADSRAELAAIARASWTAAIAVRDKQLSVAVRTILRTSCSPSTRAEIEREIWSGMVKGARQWRTARARKAGIE